MQTMISGLAAAQLGISTRTLGRWAQSGKIRSRLTPGRWRLYDPRDIARLKKTLERQGAKLQSGTPG